MRPAPTLWAEEAPIEPPWRALDDDAECAVLVIGAGLAGLAIARELARRGQDVLVVDEAAPGAGASARNAGFVLVAHVWEYPALRERVGAEGTRAMIAVARRTHARIERDHAGDDTVQHRRCGTLMLPLEGATEERATIERAAALLREDGVPCDWTAAPSGLSGFGRALSIPEDGEVHPGALVAALARDLSGTPARVAIARVDALDVSTRVARAGARRIRFGRAIVATNAWTRALVPELDDVLTPHRAQVLVTAPLPLALDRPCYANFGYDYFRQRRDGSLILGGRRHLRRDVEATDDARTTAETQDALDAFLRAHVPSASGAPIARRWAGIMGLTPDALPIVGALPRAPDAVSLLAGWSGHGLGLAIGCAELLAAQLAGDPRAVPSVLDPARFPALLRAR